MRMNSNTGHYSVSDPLISKSKNSVFICKTVYCVLSTGKILTYDIILQIHIRNILFSPDQTGAHSSLSLSWLNKNRKFVNCLITFRIEIIFLKKVLNLDFVPTNLCRFFFCNNYLRMYFIPVIRKNIATVS